MGKIEVKQPEPAGCETARQPVLIIAVGRQRVGKTTLLNVLIEMYRGLGAEIEVWNADLHNRTQRRLLRSSSPLTLARLASIRSLISSLQALAELEGERGHDVVLLRRAHALPEQGGLGVVIGERLGPHPHPRARSRCGGRGRSRSAPAGNGQPPPREFGL